MEARSTPPFTDERGRYALSLPRGSYRMVVWDDDYEREQRFETVGGPRTIDFQLVPAATIRGRVVERESGAPVSGAVVSFGRETRRGKSRSSRSAKKDEKVVTGPDGRFTLRRLSAAKYQVYAHASHFATNAPAEVTIGIAEQFDGLVVTVDPAFNIKGRVVDAADSSVGISGATVGAFGNPHRPPEAVTAEDGTFELVGILPGQHPLSVSGDGFVASMMESNVTIEDADVEDFEVAVERGVSVSGTLDPPQAADVKVSLRKDVGGFEVMLKGRKLRSATGRSDERGEFSLGTVPVGEWKLVAEGEDGSLGELEISVPEEGLDGVRLAMKPRPSVRGTVVRSDGDVPAGLTLRLTAVVESDDPMQAFHARSEAKTTVTDEAGAFELLGLASGRYELEALDRRGVAWTQTSTDDAKVVVDVTDAGVDGLVLEVDAPVGSITGVVRGPDGPVADAWVTLAQADDSPFGREPQTAVSDADGRFEFDGLPEGSYDLSANSEHRDAWGDASGIEVGDDVPLLLESLCAVAGTVTFDGRPVQQFEVDAAQVDRRFVAEDGRYSISGVKCGTTAVVVNAKEGSVMRRIETSPGDEVELDVELRSWASVTGRAVYADGSPAAGIPITWAMQAGERDRGARITQQLSGDGVETDEDGRFRVDGLGAGRGRLRFGGGNLLAPAALRGEVVVFAEPSEVLDVGDIEIRGGDPVAEEDRGSLGCEVAASAEAPSSNGWNPGPSDRPDGPPQLWIARVAPSGVAAQAGLEVGQKLLAIDGETVEDVGATALAVTLSEAWVEAGRTYALEVETDAGSKTIRVTAAAKK